MEARAFVPGHITTFFRPAGNPRGPLLQRGSLGSGFCVEEGVATRVRARGHGASTGPAPTRVPFEFDVKDNGRAVARPLATRFAMLELLRRAGPGTRLPRHVEVHNAYRLPLGAGFGISGACGLGAVLAANEVMGLGLARAACVAAAHCGEVQALTGLGDVGAQSIGGVEVRVRPGPPPTGEVRRIRTRPREVVLLSFGPRPTRAFLRNSAGKARLRLEGARCLAQLLERPSLAASVRLGREFAEALGLVSPPARRVLTALGPDALASVAMLGDSLFLFDPTINETSLRRLAPKAFVTTTRIAASGARLV